MTDHNTYMHLFLDVSGCESGIVLLSEPHTVTYRSTGAIELDLRLLQLIRCSWIPKTRPNYNFVSGDERLAARTPSQSLTATALN